MQWGRGQGPFWKDSGRSPGCRAASPAHSSDQSPRCQPSRGPDAGGETLTWAPQGGSAWGALPTPSSLWFILSLASSSHGKGKGRPHPVTLTGWTQTRLQNTGLFEGDGQTSQSPGGARPSSLPGEGLRGSGAVLPSLLPGWEPSLGQARLLLGVAPRPLPGETHTCTRLQACIHTRSHTARCARPLVLHSEPPGLQFWGAHPSALPLGGCRPLTLPLRLLPPWELCVCLRVRWGCLLTTRLVTLGDDQGYPPTSQGQDRRGVPLPTPRNKQVWGLGSQHLGL